MGVSIAEISRSLRKSVDWLLYTREELHLRQRDIAFDALRLKPRVTSAEILRADFGTDSPNGLDITAYPSLQSHITGLQEGDWFKTLSSEEQAREMRRVGGRAGAGDQIYLHPNYLGEQPPENIFGRRATHMFANIFSHEHIHRLQGEEQELGLISAMADRNMFSLTMPGQGEGITGSLKRLYQSFMQATIDRQAEKRFEFKVGDYFSKEYEIQARMHEVLAQGYAGWQRMPTTEAELQAAFINLGLPCPPDVRSALKAGEEGRQALKDFRSSPAMRHQVRHTINQINLAQDYMVFTGRKEAFWQRALPAMYGNLLELWGDGPGRARMGLGPNGRPVKDMLLAVKDPSVPVKKLQQMVENIPVVYANNAVSVLAANAGEPGSRARAVIDAFFTREDTRNALLSADTTNIEDTGQMAPAWWCAFVNGQTEVLGKFIAEGLDISRPLNFNGYDGMSRQFNVLNHVTNMAEAEKILTGEQKARTKLQKNFTEAAKTHQLGMISNIKQMLTHLAEQSDDPDRKLTFTSAAGTKDASLNDILEIVGMPRVERREHTENLMAGVELPINNNVPATQL